MDPAVFGYIRASQAGGESGLATQRRIFTGVASGWTISPRGASPPTPPGWRYRQWPTTWPAGRPASAWVSRS